MPSEIMDQVCKISSTLDSYDNKIKIKMINNHNNRRDVFCLIASLRYSNSHDGNIYFFKFKII